MVKKLLLFIALLHVFSGCGAPVRRSVSQPGPAASVVKPLPPREAPASTPAPGVPKPSVRLTPGPKTVSPLVRIPDDQLPWFADDMDIESLDRAIGKSLQFFGRASGKGPFLMGDAWVSVQELRDSLIALREILGSADTEEVKQNRIRQAFDVYRTTGLDGRNNVLITGYFESLLMGSLTKTERFKYPIYRSPADAVAVNLGKFSEKYGSQQLIGRVIDGELIPYHSRRDIEEGGILSGRNLEIAWVDDRVDLFFLHTQGSGKIELPDGSLLQIGYASRNGRPFQSVGTHLLKTGKLAPQDNSYREIKKYLKEHPEDLTEILGYNESFIFFRVVREGPVGAIEEILTPGRSIATDPDLFPKGALAFIKSRKPVLDREGNVESWLPYSRFVVSQDVGGMIKGAGRVDLFCGSGTEAEMVAGSLKEKGELYFLVKKRANGSANSKPSEK